MQVQPKHLLPSSSLSGIQYKHTPSASTTTVNFPNEAYVSWNCEPYLLRFYYSEHWSDTWDSGTVI